MSYQGIPYHLYFDDRTCRISIDNLRLKFSYPDIAYDYSNHESCPFVSLVSEQIFRHCFQRFLLFDRQDIVPLDFNSTYSPFKIGSYQQVFRIANDIQDWSFAILIGRYTFDKEIKQIAPEIIVDINPNKVPHDIYLEFYKLLITGASVSIVRYDLAFDFVIDRSSVTLRPSKRRQYKLFKSGAALTEYQGVRNSHGSVKIYNKQLESDLEFPCTRVEITIDGDFDKSISSLFPDLGVIGNTQLDFDFSELPFEVQAIILHPDLISLLDNYERHTRSKFLKIIREYTSYDLQPSDFTVIDKWVKDTLSVYRYPKG